MDSFQIPSEFRKFSICFIECFVTLSCLLRLLQTDSGLRFLWFLFTDRRLKIKQYLINAMRSPYHNFWCEDHRMMLSEVNQGLLSLTDMTIMIGMKTFLNTGIFRTQAQWISSCQTFLEVCRLLVIILSKSRVLFRETSDGFGHFSRLTE
jgi:hypothetical protein